MTEEKQPKAILTEMIRKRDELNIAIRILSETMGITDSAQAEVGDTPKPVDRRGVVGTDFDPQSVVFPGMFFGKSQTQATKLLLEQVRPRPLKTKTIAECLEKGGKKVEGKKPLVNLWGALNRDKETFVLVPKAGWGLVEWYDPATIAKLSKESGKADDEAENNGDQK